MKLPMLFVTSASSSTTTTMLTGGGANFLEDIDKDLCADVVDWSRDELKASTLTHVIVLLTLAIALALTLAIPLVITIALALVIPLELKA